MLSEIFFIYKFFQLRVFLISARCVNFFVGQIFNLHGFAENF